MLITNTKTASQFALLRHLERLTPTWLSILMSALIVPECPVEAIFADTDLPDEFEEWLDRNEEESVDLPIAEGDSPVLA